MGTSIKSCAKHKKNRSKPLTSPNFNQGCSHFYLWFNSITQVS